MSCFFDPDGYYTIPLKAELDLNKVGFEVIERGVKELVKVLWKLGYKTICSCGGHQESLEPYPWVSILVNPCAKKKTVEKLALLIARFNRSLAGSDCMPSALDVWVLSPQITISGFTIYLQPLDANVSRSSERLSALRKSADNLASFIKEESKNVF